MFHWLARLDIDYAQTILITISLVLNIYCIREVRKLRKDRDESKEKEDALAISYWGLSNDLRQMSVELSDQRLSIAVCSEQLEAYATRLEAEISDLDRQFDRALTDVVTDSQLNFSYLLRHAA